MQSKAKQRENRQTSALFHECFGKNFGFLKPRQIYFHQYYRHNKVLIRCLVRDSPKLPGAICQFWYFTTIFIKSFLYMMSRKRQDKINAIIWTHCVLLVAVSLN
jgi:hypothetical protein